MQQISQARSTDVKGKFTSDEVQQIIIWIAEFKKTTEIKELVKKMFGKTICNASIENYSTGQKWQPLVRKYREAWGREIMTIELAHKRRRIDELQEIFFRTKEKKDYKLAMEALDKIKNETEKELGNLHLYNIKVYKNMTDEEIESERLKTIEEIKKIKELRGITYEQG